jgi:hypothetical protein
MSPEAHQYLLEKLEVFRKEGNGNFKVFYFDRGQPTTNVQRELYALGLIRMMGTSGAGWAFTPAGYAAVT